MLVKAASAVLKLIEIMVEDGEPAPEFGGTIWVMYWLITGLKINGYYGVVLVGYLNLKHESEYEILESQLNRG